MRMGWLAWISGLLPITGTAASGIIAMQLGLVPACNPFLEGCTSISATGREFPASLAFRATMLPAAAFMAMFWVAAWHWLRRLGAPSSITLHAIPAAGLVAALFLIVYVTFLGTQSEVYSFMRRFGVIHFFAFTYLAQLLIVRVLYRLPGPSLPERRWMLGFCAALLALGLASILVDLTHWDTNEVENVLEWNGALLLMAMFPLCALAWRRTDFRLTPQTRSRD